MSQASIQHTFNRKRFQTRNQATALAILSVAILLILGSLYLSQVASYAITNREIEDLIARRDTIKRENEQLIGEIARFRTVPSLYTRAVEIGFRPATNSDIDYLLIEGYNPDRARLPAATPSLPETGAAAASAAPVYDETFSAWLAAQLRLLREQFDSFGK